MACTCCGLDGFCCLRPSLFPANALSVDVNPAPQSHLPRTTCALRMSTYGTMASPTAEPTGAGAGADSKPDAAHAMDKARDAFAAGDLEASAAAHRAKAGIVSSPEQHGGAGSDYIKSIVFGGLDGIITSYAVVASVGGANLPLTVTLITGIAKLLGDGLAMGIGDAISEGAEHSFIRGERAREKW